MIESRAIEMPEPLQTNAMLERKTETQKR